MLITAIQFICSHDNSSTPGHLQAHLPNTDTYLERLKQRYSGRFPPGTIVFSLDVTNLYGNIPTDEAVQIVMNLLQEHRDSINLFGLSWTDVEPLLNHCLSNSYLSSPTIQSLNST